MSVDTILAELNALPIFKMSLGSKELFHSNFLEYLWELDNAKFVDMINELFGNKTPITQGVEYELSREKENFDICLYHTVGNKVVYDVIIENKVKSIPSKERQLDRYVAKVDKKDGARFLLLSLIEEFPDREAVEKEGVWEIVNYDQLHSAIVNHFGKIGDNNQIYIDDYCSFISLLQDLAKEIIPADFKQESLWKDYNKYKRYRLHDLYVKLQGLAFMQMLEGELSKRNRSCKVVNVGGKALREWWEKNPKKRADVYLNWNVFNASGQIAAFLYNGGKEIFEVVVQGEQYRHGINYYDGMATDAESIWAKVKKHDFIEAISHAGKSEHCKYSNDYVYVYEKITNEKIVDLLDRMVDDIVKTKKFL